MTAQHRPLTVSASPAGLCGRVHVPGDKSISHRSLMFAALAQGTTQISGLLEGEDVLCTAGALRQLGAKITRGETTWRVEGCGVGQLKEPSDVLDMGNSGTAARLLTGLLATHPIMSVMSGDSSLRSRPMKRVTAPLSETGAQFLTREGQRLPLAVQGTGAGKPLQYRLPVASAQVKSAVLLSGLNCHGTTVVEEPVLSRDHTENMLQHFGVDVQVSPLEGGGRTISLQGPATLTARDVVVPGDPSSAAFPLVAALLVPGSDCVIEGVGLNPLRTGLFISLQEMGASLEILNERIEGGESVGDLHVRAGALKGVTVPPERVPSMIDEYPILAVACAFAEGTSRLQGLAELRVKESDRLASTVALLEVNGARVHVESDDLIIEGQPSLPGGGQVLSHMDHRLAMSAIVLGLAAQKPVSIDDTAFIETSFPGFVDVMNTLGAGITV
ncbi:3-phosphoshikimate 1-carboxyvinyltransferase [Saccharibacter sp. EH611]|uniref:3-phosphoshikimate 1-carboxyvinyltransferase n=1 Tax=unclassified Saccharibacter TaxID=2648722 RepID=UPI00132B5652|nr:MULTISPECIES: 3-phosphoshikimate 1-carboxyvinyltransferase [unclassified Saccharibacter]MXV36696.1 3-phosphoshikimate 1-carboxyvinyltransferase [Saccharibacter sp. EH611]MXV65644.1 3-phosphoshikimate 1-carboxyvinyltransferase [Saccharibacter sp. EH60]